MRWYNKGCWLNKLGQIVTPVKARTFFKIFGGCVILICFFLFFPFFNNSFYGEDIQGQINEIVEESKAWKIQIDSSWYFVQMPYVDSLSKGDLIVKPKKSFSLTIYTKERQVKFKKELRNIIFKRIEKKKSL